MAQSQSSFPSQAEDKNVEQMTGVQAFWPKPSALPRFIWKDWINNFYMAADLKDGCYTRTLLTDPAAVILEPPPKEEQADNGESNEARSAREARILALQQKHTAVNEEIKRRGPRISHGVYYHELEVKVRARLFIALGKEGQRRFTQKHPKVKIHETKFKDFAKLLETLFDAEKNTTFERMSLFTREQKVGESMECFHAALSEQATKCELGTLEEDLIRDLFIARMKNEKELQRKFIMEKTSTAEVVKQIVLYERGTKNNRNVSIFLVQTNKSGAN